MNGAFNRSSRPRTRAFLRRPHPSVVACSPTLGALGAVNLMPAYFVEEDALDMRIARSSRRRRAVSALLRWLTYLAAAVTAAVLLFVVGYILVRGVPALTPDLFQWEYTSENVSLLPALASTVVMALLALALAVPWVSARPSTWWSTLAAAAASCAWCA